MNKEDLMLERQLVLMSAIEIDDSKAEEFKQIVCEKLQWSEVLFQMVTHRTLNMFYYNLKKFGLVNKLEKEIQRLLESQWEVYGQRNKYYLQELGKILNKFERAGLVVPIVKGNLLASKVYPTIETRIFNDLDMLMKLGDVVLVTRELEGLGYIQGHYDEESGVIVEATRKEKVLQQVASHELQEFQKIGENSFAKLIQVDVNHDILWKGNCPYKVETKVLIDRAISIELGNANGYMLNYIDNIMQLSAHLYKEATLMMWITDIRDLKIYKFADLYMYIYKFFKQIDWELLVKRVNDYNMSKVVYYNFHYITLMFGALVPEFVMESLRPSDLSYLDEYGIENREPSKWDLDFFTRLFDTDRVLSISEDKLSNMSRFLSAKIESDGVFKHRAL